MGTKKSQREFHERQNNNNEVNPLMAEDSSTENQRKGFVSNNDLTSRHDADGVSFNLEGDANLNNHETGKRKKKNKRKSDHSDGDVETREARKQDVVDNDVVKGINKRERSEKNIGDKVAKHGHGIDSAEIDAKEGMLKAKDGKKDEKKRKKQKREKDMVGADSAEIDGIEGLSRAQDGKKDEKKRKKQKREKDTGGVDSVENDAIGVSKDEDAKEDEKKKKKKREKDTGGADSVEHDAIEEISRAEKDEKKKKQKRENDIGGADSVENDATEGISRTKDGKKDEKKRKKQKREKDIGGTEVISGRIDGKEVGDAREHHIKEKEAKDGKKDEKKRKKKRKREKDGDEIDGKEAGTEKESPEENIPENAEPSRKKRKQKIEHNVEKKKKKKKKGKDRSDDELIDTSARSTPKGASKRVSFSEDVEIFPSSDSQTDDEESVQNKKLVRGKRFSPEEDDMIKESVLNYIDQHELGEEGINMILKCRKHPEIRNCWKEIAAALPWRPLDSVYHRAHVLFERADKRKWTEEEYELIRKFHEKHGADWRTLGDALGKHRFHVKDTWRRINVANRKRGNWSQDEYQSLFDLVNMDLRMRVFEERKSKHGMLRDNISWTAISQQLGTRAIANCCMKWYDNLSSPMVAEGKWLDVDDYRLVIALYEVDAGCMEDIDWDGLLEHRPGDVCRKRWNQMVKHLGEVQNKSFSEQVEVLMNRYCPDVLEAREVYESKPIVDLDEA